jgi:putative FmdB family regulatory protein
MPLYEYLCETCGERTEILQRFNDLPEVACPKCGAAIRARDNLPVLSWLLLLLMAALVGVAVLCASTLGGER